MAEEYQGSYNIADFAANAAHLADRAMRLLAMHQELDALDKTKFPPEGVMEIESLRDLLRKDMTFEVFREAERRLAALRKTVTG